MQLPLRCFSKSPMAFQTVSWDLWVVPADPPVVPDIFSNLLYLDIKYNRFKEIVSNSIFCFFYFTTCYRASQALKGLQHFFNIFLKHSKLNQYRLMIFKILLGLFFAEIKCEVVAC
jgi:hypothetical protein